MATLLLYLNQYHLVQNGNKAAKAQRLYSHLQSLQDAHISSCSGSDRSSSDSDGEQSEDEGEAPISQNDGSRSKDASTGRVRTDHSHGGQEGRPSVTTEPPFTKAQQRALTATIKSALKDRKTSKRSRHHRSPSPLLLIATRRVTGAAPLPTRNVQDTHVAPVCHQVARPAVLPHLVPTLIPLQITADTTAGTDTSMASTTTMAEQDDTSTGPMFPQYLTRSGMPLSEVSL